MSRAPALVLLLGLALAAPEALAAGGGDDHGPAWQMLFFQILNVGILGFLLYRFAGPAIAQYLRDRSEGVRDEIERAQAQLREVEQENVALRERLERIDAESEALVEQVVTQARAEAERGAARAAQSAEHIGEEARRVADNEIVRARQALREEAAELATQLAGELLREQISDEDDRRLVAEFTGRIGEGS